MIEVYTHPANWFAPLTANATDTTFTVSTADAAIINTMRLAYGGSVRMLIFAPSTYAYTTGYSETILVDGAPSAGAFTVVAMTNEAQYTTANGAMVGFNLVCDGDGEQYNAELLTKSNCNAFKVTTSLSGSQALDLNATAASGYASMSIINIENNLIGVPGAAGFGIGVAPASALFKGMTALGGYNIIGNDNYGNYRFVDNSVMCWVPKFYYRIGHASNPTYATHGVNSIDIKGIDTYATTALANADGYALHRMFIDGGQEKDGVFVDKYKCSKNALGTGYVASSIQNGMPISTSSAHNPISQLTATPTNAYWSTLDAAKARDGANGAKNSYSRFFCMSQFIANGVFLLSLAHGQASSSTTNCAWYHTTYNYPKGCNNDALKDADDTTVIWESDGYTNCGKTGSAGYGGGGGNVFAKSTHNGQNCGIADLNGLIYEIRTGLTCIGASKSIIGIAKENPCRVTISGHGYITGDYIMILSVGGMTVLNNKIYTITTVDANDFTLDGVDSTGFADYTSGGTCTKGIFYAVKQTTRMRDFTSGNSLATDHWGAMGVAAMMDTIVPTFETGYSNNGFSQRLGGSTNQVFAGDTSGAAWLKTCLGIPIDANAIDTSGTNLFGKDYYYQSITNELCLLGCGNWGNNSYAGGGYLNWNTYRASSSVSVGFRAACYPE